MERYNCYSVESKQKYLWGDISILIESFKIYKAETDSYSFQELINLLKHKEKMYYILEKLEDIESNWSWQTYGREEKYGICHTLNQINQSDIGFLCHKLSIKTLTMDF